MGVHFPALLPERIECRGRVGRRCNGQFPLNAGMNPIGTVGALTYLAGDGLVNKHLKDPGNVIAS